MLGTSPQPEGITNPPIDDLLEKVDSKYGLVVEAAKRARQINTYTQQLEDNQFEFFGPLVDSEVGEKSLGIALREIAEDKLEVIPGDVARARRAEPRRPVGLPRPICSATFRWTRRSPSRGARLPPVSTTSSSEPGSPWTSRTLLRVSAP